MWRVVFRGLDRTRGVLVAGALHVLVFAVAVGREVNLRTVGLAAAFAGALVPILFGIYEVQGWRMPTPLAVPLIVLMVVMIAVAAIVMVAEVVRTVNKVRENRATSAAWVSREAPGLLDFEADGERAALRLAKELTGLAGDTARLGGLLQSHTHEFESVDLRVNPKKKQKKANASAKSIDRSAIYVERRVDLLNALVEDVFRNYRGVVEHMELITDEDIDAAKSLLTTLDDGLPQARDILESTRTYRDTVQGVHDKNLSRSVRIASGRLVGALDDVIKALSNYHRGTRRLAGQLRKRVDRPRT